MSNIQIYAQKRTLTRKLRKLTNASIIPCVVYDQKCNSENIQTNMQDFEKILPDVTPTTLIDLVIERKDSKLVHITEVQRDLRRNNIQHVSFLALDTKKESPFTVKIQFSGESVVIKNNLGILVTIRDSVDLKGLPQDIPEFLEVDLSTLKDVGDTLTCKDLDIPKGAKFVREDDSDLTIITVSPFQKAVEEETKPEDEEDTDTEVSDEEGATDQEPKSDDTTSDKEPEKDKSTKKSSNADSRKKTKS